jgi:hypothetical protein
MGFVLSILYFVVSYLSPAAIFGSLAQYRLELILAIAILLVSLPKLIGSFIFRTPQSLALVGLSVAVFLSVLVGVHWAGGAMQSFAEFIPSIYFYFLVCLHCNSRARMKLLVLTLLLVCVFVTARGIIDLHRVASEGGPPASEDTESFDWDQWNNNHAYLLTMRTDKGEWIYRIRGLGTINDPNDFGQLLISVIPLLFFFWDPENRIQNAVCVVVPTCLLLIGIYLTHSRGALIALVAVVIVAARRRIGTAPAIVLAVGLFAAAIALQFTGGRAISAEAGVDRTALWGGGLQVLKSYPLFGVGLERLSDYLGQTAHNSIVVCVAELGLVGLYFWSLFLLPTVRNAIVASCPDKVGEAQQVEAEESPFLMNVWNGGPLSKTEVNRFGFCLLLSLIGFLVSGWFLSRAFVPSLFLLGGMVQVVYEAGRREGMIDSDLPFLRVLAYSLALAAVLLIVVYVMVRLLNFLH